MSKLKQTNTPDFSKEIMTQINSGQVRMRSKIYYAMGSIGLGIAISLLASLGALIISLVILRLRIAGPVEYLRFGPQGIRPFIANIPIVFIILAFLAIILVIFMLKKYDFSYRHNWWGISLGVIALIITSGMVFDTLGSQQYLLRRSVLRPLLTQQSTGDNWLTGEIIFQNHHIWQISTLDQQLVQMNIESASLPRRPMGQGEVIRAVGEWRQDMFMAEAVFGNGRPRHWPEGMGPRKQPFLRKQ